MVDILSTIITLLNNPLIKIGPVDVQLLKQNNSFKMNNKLADNIYNKIEFNIGSSSSNDLNIAFLNKKKGVKPLVMSRLNNNKSDSEYIEVSALPITKIDHIKIEDDKFWDDSFSDGIIPFHQVKLKIVPMEFSDSISRFSSFSVNNSFLHFSFPNLDSLNWQSDGTINSLNMKPKTTHQLDPLIRATKIDKNKVYFPYKNQNLGISFGAQIENVVLIERKLNGYEVENYIIVLK